MKTRKPTLAENVRLLKNEIERREMMLRYCHDAKLKAEEQSWIANARKQISGFYAPATR